MPRPEVCTNSSKTLLFIRSVKHAYFQAPIWPTESVSSDGLQWGDRAVCTLKSCRWLWGRWTQDYSQRNVALVSFPSVSHLAGVEPSFVGPEAYTICRTLFKKQYEITNVKNWHSDLEGAYAEASLARMKRITLYYTINTLHSSTLVPNTSYFSDTNWVSYNLT